MKLYAFLTVLLLLTAALANAADPKRQQQIRQEIQQLTNSLNAAQNTSDALQDEVTRIEKKLNEVSRRLYQTEQKIEETQLRLETTNDKKHKQEMELSRQRAALAQQLQALYSAGQESHLRLLLRQDDPADISRMMRYFDYMNKSRIKRIQSIQKTLDALQTLRTAIDKDRRYLQNLEQTQQRDKEELTRTLLERTNSMKKMNSDVRAKQKRLEKLRAEDAKLTEVIDQLAMEREKATETKSKAEKAVSTNEKKLNPPPTPTTTHFTPDKAFSSLKGSLSWPVAGKIIHPYDTVKNEKQRWRGVVIAAPGGTKVKAVARGKVLFSGWMDTYGHMIIIEHDSNYISLYGYNRAVYKKEGDIVKANETIAAVGASGGQSSDALYFEIRQGKTPQNPARWCR